MSFFKLLAGNKQIRTLSLVQIFAYMGAWFSNVAIYSMLVELHASAMIISIIVSLHFLPSIVLSPIVGTIIDRSKLKKLMILLLIIELIMTFGYIFITSLDYVFLLMILIFVRMSSASIFFISEMTLITKLFKDELLIKANAIHAVIWSFAFTAGISLGGVVVHYFGNAVAYLVDILFFAVAIFFLFRLQADIDFIKPKNKIIQSIKDGITYTKSHKKILYYIFLHSSVGLTSFDALVTILAGNEYKYIISAPLAIGISGAIRSIGIMIGPIVLTHFVNDKRLFYIFLFQAFGIFMWAMLQFNFYLALLGLFLTGFCTAVLWSYTYTMLQKEIKPEYLGRVLSYNEVSFMLVNVGTTFFIGFFAKHIPLWSITVLLGIGFLVFAYIYKRNYDGR